MCILDKYFFTINNVISPYLRIWFVELNVKFEFKKKITRITPKYLVFCHFKLPFTLLEIN